MITITKRKGKSILEVGKERIPPIDENIFALPYSVLLNEDLSTVDPDVEIIIDHRGRHGRTLDQYIMLSSIRVLDQSKVQAEGNHYRCPCCWTHAMDYQKYMAASELTFQMQPPGNFNFKYVGVTASREDELYQFFSLEVANGLFKDIEQVALDAVRPILQPLLDFRTSLDDQMRKRFGV